MQASSLREPYARTGKLDTSVRIMANLMTFYLNIVVLKRDLSVNQQLLSG